MSYHWDPGSEDRLSSTLETLYANAGDLQGWPKTLGEVVKFVGAEAGFAGVLDSPSRSVVSVFAGLPDPDKWLNWRPSPQLMKEMKTLFGRAVRSTQESQSAMARNVLATTFATDGPRSVSVALLRQTPFVTEELDRLEAVIPHLRNLFRIHVKVTGLSIRMLDLRGVLDMFDSAILLARRTGQLFLSNAAAERLLARGDGICVKDGRIQAVTQRESPTLSTAIERVGCREESMPLHSLMLTRRREDDGRFLVHIIRLPPAADPTGVTGADVAIVVSAATSQRQPPTAVLKAMGLTPAEVRLAAALSAGERLDDIATRLGVTKGTLRSQLLDIFRKTATDRQADLISFLQGLATVSLRFTE